MNKKAIELPVKNDFLETVINSIDDKKGENTVLIDLKNIDNSIANYFVITEADSHTQVKAISDNVQRKVKEIAHQKPFGVEGEENAEWILLDYGDIIVHVFYRPVREYYDLESLWGDAEVLPVNTK